MVELIAAPFTAMHTDGSVHLEAIPEQAERMRADGVAGVFICGTTGESSSLTSDEREAIAETWLANRSDLEVIVHVGHANVGEARRLAAHAESIGAQAIGAVPPYYQRPKDIDALVHVCARIAAAAPRTPYLYYHIPSMTHVNLSMPEFVAAAREHIPTFAGVKYTDEGLTDLDRCLQVGAGLRFLFGRDEILLTALALGVTAAVGSSYNYAAPHYHRIADAHSKGDPTTAQALQRQARQLIDIGIRYGGLPAFKALGSRRGPELGPCREPVPTLTDEQRAELYDEVARLGIA